MGIRSLAVLLLVVISGLAAFPLGAQTDPTPTPAATASPAGQDSSQATTAAPPDSFLTPGLAEALSGARAQDPGSGISAALIDLLSQENQAQGWVRSIYHSSFMLGGLGYLRQDEYGLGALFGGLDLAVMAGTLIGAHALLPSQVQVQNLDYFASSCTDLESAWKSLGLVDVLPALAVLAGGSAARMVILSLEADGARKAAVEKVRSGSKKFAPKPWMALDSRGGLYLGMSFNGPGW